jgi:hypothetical protein
VSELSIRLVLLLLWAAVVSLDERAFGSYMFHQPLVAGWVAGAIVGHAQGGLAAGLVFQCLWPGLLPIGGDLLPSVGIASVLAGAVTGWGSHLVGTRAVWTANGPLFFGVSLGLPAGWFGMLWERATRERNARREQAALASGAPLEEALAGALRASYADTALRGVVVVGGGILLAATVYLWPAAIRILGASPCSDLGASLRLAALGLGLGVLLFALGGARRKHVAELIWGLAAGIILQLLRGL